ncbi:MAG: DUF1549 and DUF1553 domain-containing protein [Pirellulaceae bacterium]
MSFTVLLAMAAYAANPAAAVDFDTQIVPILTRAGCNAGSCHGAAAGRGGFHLSLLGADPAADHEAIVHEYEGRRVNLATPSESLVLAKPTGRLLHEGGEPLEWGGRDANLLEAWIASGASREGPRRLVRLDVAPHHAVLESPGEKVALQAVAHFDDGSQHDVTSWTVFTSADPGAVALDAAMSATILRPGQHLVHARFLDRVVPLRLTLPLAREPVDLSGERRSNFIDEEVLKTLAVLRIPVSPEVDDATFLRRLRLDLTGRLPSLEEVHELTADGRPGRREEWIDRLLRSDDFVEYWTYRLMLLLRVRPPPNDRDSARVYRDWLRDQLQRRTPLNEVAHELLTATGDTQEVGAANFARSVLDARAHAELVSQVFLGVRLQCANCHNHPLDRWTQDDYHGLAAIFSRLDRGPVVRLASRGGVTNPRTGEPAIERLPGGPELPPDADHRRQFADWLTRPDNDYFARALVNRLWRGMFGRGLVEPVDDLRDTNPATHPELLNALAKDFVDHGFDLRHTLRRIASSATYQRSSVSLPGNASDDRFYSRAYRRPMEPEVLADALADVTGLADNYGDEPNGTRAITLFDPRTPAESLDVLGRCSRAASCDEVEVSGSLPAKLHQLNGGLINRKITAREGHLHLRLRSGASHEEVLVEFYERALGRTPRPAETAFWHEQLTSEPPDRRTELLEDIVWGLLSCSEFCLNH